MWYPIRGPDISLSLLEKNLWEEVCMSFVAVRSTATTHQVVCPALEHTAIKDGGYQSLGFNRACPITSYLWQTTISTLLTYIHYICCTLWRKNSLYQFVLSLECIPDLSPWQEKRNWWKQKVYIGRVCKHHQGCQGLCKVQNILQTNILTIKELGTIHCKVIYRCKAERQRLFELNFYTWHIGEGW